MRLKPKFDVPLLLAQLQEIPQGYRQRVACIVWWDHFSKLPNRKVPKELRALVSEGMFLDAYPVESLVPFLVGLGYTQHRAEARCTPVHQNTTESIYA